MTIENTIAPESNAISSISVDAEITRPGGKIGKASLIKLAHWLEITYRGDAPRIETARRWARLGLISPKPIKHGRDFFLQSDAVYKPATRCAPEDCITGDSQ